MKGMRAKSNIAQATWPMGLATRSPVLEVWCGRRKNEATPEGSIAADAAGLAGVSAGTASIGGSTGCPESLAGTPGACKKRERRSRLPVLPHLLRRVQALNTKPARGPAYAREQTARDRHAQ